MFFLSGTIINTVAVTIGAILGLLMGKAIPKRIADTVFMGLGLCTLFIGITGIFTEGVNTLVIIGSMVIGAVIGEAFDLDKKINNLGKWIENKFKKNDEKVSIAQGFVSASLLFCVGAMTIVGSLQGGLANDHTTLITKSILDFVASIIFASTLGIGVVFSAAFVFVYQGAIATFAYFAAEIFGGAQALQSETLTPFMITINTMNCVGYLIIIGLAFNMLKLTKLKVMNFVPAIFMPIALCPLADFITSLIG